VEDPIVFCADDGAVARAHGRIARYVKACRLGRKAGRGVYEYDEEGRRRGVGA
jgi:3-hydroxyacyl-CoA dehydrogenase